MVQIIFSVLASFTFANNPKTIMYPGASSVAYDTVAVYSIEEMNQTGEVIPFGTDSKEQPTPFKKQTVSDSTYINMVAILCKEVSSLERKMEDLSKNQNEIAKESKKSIFKNIYAAYVFGATGTYLGIKIVENVKVRGR